MSTKYVVHVNREFISHNTKNPELNLPVWIVRRGRSGNSRYAHSVKMLGDVVAVQSAKPLSCGAKAWIECSDVELENEVDYATVRAKIVEAKMKLH